ncbi:hypothetical protein O1L55_09545 [Streptomyces albulus]|nr:hypothetical protein [Streptomyces noursei]
MADAPEELVVALQEADGARRFEVRGAHRAAGTAAPVHARGVLVPADRAPRPRRSPSATSRTPARPS